ncbi:MAG: radical SAM protein [Bacteroidales bacterium]|nr:radical SAM protein [Bacteroidales bacterium]
MYKVWLRGLIEISNRCRKNCLYCGIRAGNCKVRRYELSNGQILQAAQFALDNGYGSVVLQAGERCDSDYVENIARLVYDITHLHSSTFAPLAVTLSLGEQSRDVYKLWHEAGAGRYLLRIEASDKDLYERIHPGTECNDINPASLNNESKSRMSSVKAMKAEHSYDTRVECIDNLKSLGYITGSGMMIGLPFQTRENLEHDIDFMVRHKIDMVGMGPYIPHEDTPLGQLFSLAGSKVRNNDKAVECIADECAVPLDHGKENCYGIENVKEAQADNEERICCNGEKLWGEFIKYSGEEKVKLTIAVTKELRRRLPDINIAATTALQVLSPAGREEAIRAGANVVMPNITLPDAKREYKLYQGKTSVDDSPENVKKELERNLADFGCTIAWGEAGNPPFRH